MIASLVLALLAVVNNPNNAVAYACNGALSPSFTVNFPYLSSGDLVVTSTGPGGSPVTTLAPTTDWTINASRSSSTGVITLTNPAVKCPAGNTLTIVRTLALTQPQPFKGQGTFNPSIHEDAYDRLLMQLQQINANAATSVLTTKGDLIGRTLTVPSRIPVGTNGQVLTANSLNANGVAWGTPGSNTDATLTGDGFTSPLSINVANSNTWSVPQTIAVISASPALTLQGGNSTSGNALQATGGNSTTGGAAAINATGGCGTLTCGPGINASGSTKGPGGIFTGSAVRGSVQLVAQARPSTPSEGDTYEDSTSHRSFIWNGSSWVATTIGADTVANNLVFAGPTTGGPLAPTFRALTAADAPLTTQQTQNTTSGGCAIGGTNIATLTIAVAGTYLVMGTSTITPSAPSNFITLALTKAGVNLTGTSVTGTDGGGGIGPAGFPAASSTVTTFTASQVLALQCISGAGTGGWSQFSLVAIRIG